MKVLHTLVFSLGLFAVSTAGQVNVEATNDKAEMPFAQTVKKEKVTLVVSGMT